jgi:hypothetical protein
MVSSNPFAYTDKTFERVLSSINSNNELVDKPNWFKNMIAGLADISAMWNNAAANNCLLGTAFTRRNVQLLLELIDYNMFPQSTSTTQLIFLLPDDIVFPVTFSASELVAITPGTVAVSSLRFEARTGITLTTQEKEAFIPGDIDIINNEITVSREFQTGEKIQFTTAGTLPAPFQLLTSYYVIRIDASTIQIALSITDSFKAIPIDIIDTGIGGGDIELYSFRHDVYQQTSRTVSSIGQSDGVTKFQKYNLPDINILKDTLLITINSINWNQKETLVESSDTDTDYRLFYNSDQSSYIMFGDGFYGAIPPAEFDIEASYAIGGGSISNVNQLNRINTYAGTSENIDGCTNYSSAVGGNEPQAIEQAKILGPLLLKALNRFVTGSDGEALTIAFGGIAIAKVNDNAFGTLSAQVLTVPNGGGFLSPTTKSELQQYLIDRTVLESIDVRVEDAVYVTINVDSSAKLLPGFNWVDDVENYYRLAWKLFFTETGQEIKTAYESDGIESAITKINTYLNESFTTADNNQIIELLNNLIPRDFADEIQDTDAITYVQGSVFGIDYLSITLPAFPITNDIDEITTIGTVTVTEIT